MTRYQGTDNIKHPRKRERTQFILDNIKQAYMFSHLPFIKKLPNYSKTAESSRILLEIALNPNLKSATQVVYSNESPKEAKEDFIMALQLLPRAKIFEVSPIIAHLLATTENIVSPTRLPFSPTFIECPLYYESAWVGENLPLLNQHYHGLLLIEGEPLKTSGKPIHLTHLVLEDKELIEKPYPNIFIYAITEDEKGVGHIKISLYNDYTQQGVALDPRWQNERDYLRTFVMNFLDFLNDPDVETVRVLRSDKSVRKAIAKHKKLGAVKETSVVRLTGKLKIYVDRIQSHSTHHAHYSHRFRVRGHWRHLTAKYWTHMRGRKVFVADYIKGEGMLREKKYLLNRQDAKTERDRFVEKLHG